MLDKKTKTRLRRFEIVGFVFNCIAATLLHFLYDWSGGELFTALFCSVNESVWEHVKIFTVPYVVWGFVEVFCVGVPFKRFAVSKVAGLYVIVIVLPAFFYTYTGIIGRSFTVVDIASGFLITALSYVISYRLATNAPYIGRYFTSAMVLFFIYCCMTAFFTFAPPQIGLFADPITGGFGIMRNAPATQ